MYIPFFENMSCGDDMMRHSSPSKTIGPLRFHLVTRRTERGGGGPPPCGSRDSSSLWQEGGVPHLAAGGGPPPCGKGGKDPTSCGMRGGSPPFVARGAGPPPRGIPLIVARGGIPHLAARGESPPLVARGGAPHFVASGGNPPPYGNMNNRS